MVGSPNHKVELLDLAIGPKAFDKQHIALLKTFSDNTQKRDEAIVQTGLTNFLMRWCMHCNTSNDMLQATMKPFELDTRSKDRLSEFYSSPPFREFEKRVPKLAISFIKETLVEGTADVAPLRKMLSREIASLRKQTVTADSWEQKGEWFEKQMLNIVYKTGYAVRFTKLWSMPFHTLVFIMSHGFYWSPGRTPTETLFQFLQNGGTGQHKWNPPETYFFPNPSAPYVSIKQKFLTSKTLVHFIPENMIKVSSIIDIDRK